ncbi:MAG: family 16 glycosylhydrolase [Gracilimonas sp.]
MRYLTLSLFCILILSTSVFSQRFELVWSDEFNESSIATDTWTAWEGTAYNNEHQYYTPRESNLFLEDGLLHIVGLRENYEGQDWTSARINTQNNFEFMYGRVEIRAKLPAGKGLWPAFWMLGSNIDDSGIGWPYSGEIDMMEYRGHITNQTTGTVHFSAVEPDFPRDPNADRRYIGQEYELPTGNFASDFHLFQFEWTDSLLTWSVDGEEFFNLTKEEIELRTSYYPFDQPFYLILNLAIGGNFLGDQQPDESTPDRNELLIDYVRVYQDINEKPNIYLNFEDTEQIDPYTTINIEPEISDSDGEVEFAEFYINDELVASDSTAPYHFTWTPGIEGCYNLKVLAKDNDNGVGKNSRVSFVVGSGCTQTPFSGQPAEFPGTLELENYDLGGQHRSYYDTTPDTNLGNALGNDFRTTEAVDIIPDENSDGENYLITSTENGEWTKYQIEILHSGTYDIEFRSVPGSGSARINFLLDGEDWIYFTRIASQDGTIYNTKTLTDVELEKGKYELEMYIAQNGGSVKPDYLKAILKNSTSVQENSESEYPASIKLNQNYPNPFNPVTNISVEINEPKTIELNVYNSLGQLVNTLYSGRLSAGFYTYTFNAENLGSGIYYYQLETNGQTFTRKMVLVK